MSEPDKIFDGLLVLQYKAGSETALNLLVKRHHIKMYKQAYWYTRDAEISKDVTQDAWNKIVLKLHTLKDGNLFGSWALRIVTRKALNAIRKKNIELKHLKELQKLNVSEEYSDEKSSKVKSLRAAITSLNTNQKQILRLFYTQHYSLKEISDILDISEGTVKSRLFHAREKLKLLMK